MFTGPFLYCLKQIEPILSSGVLQLSPHSKDTHLGHSGSCQLTLTDTLWGLYSSVVVTCRRLIPSVKRIFYCFALWKIPSVGPTVSLPGTFVWMFYRDFPHQLNNLWLLESCDTAEDLRLSLARMSQYCQMSWTKENSRPHHHKSSGALIISLPIFMSQGVVGDYGYSYGYAIAIKMTNGTICAYELELQLLQRVWEV